MANTLQDVTQRELHRLPLSSKIVPEMNLQAARRYKPKFYPGRMTVFLSGAVPEDFELDIETDLHGMCAEQVDIYRVPGDRHSMIDEPFVRALADQLRAFLSKIHY